MMMFILLMLLISTSAYLNDPETAGMRKPVQLVLMRRDESPSTYAGLETAD